MLNDHGDFKKERNEAIKSGDIFLLREFSKKYGIKLPANDQEALDKAKNAIQWD